MFSVGGVASLGAASRIGGVASPMPAFVIKADGVPADIYMDFINGNYYGAGPSMFTRASPAWADNSAGIWSQFGVNVPCITNKGLLIGGPAVNLALYCRDLTQQVWVTTGMTAALNQVGIDAVANSATLLTATAANATVLQAIINPSNTIFTSFFLKRVAGTGVINITTDGGTTWTAKTLTTLFTRVYVTQTLLTNPTIGIQIVTAGDAIVVDFAQCEIGTTTANGAPTPPILTTTITNSHSTDMCLITGLSIGSAITLLAACTPMNNQAGTPVVASISDGTANNRLYVARAGTNARAGVVIAGTSTVIVIPMAWADAPGNIAASGSQRR